MKKTAIRCPNCGCEYLPGAIYLPNSFVGQPTNIVKSNVNGEVLGYDGDDMDLAEEYICDKCGKTFAIEATITFKTILKKDLFDDEFDVPSKKE